jgi:hypothetical protein
MMTKCGLRSATALRKSAVIVASGPSARGFKPPKGLTVIAVNGAIDWLTHADYFFTLDCSIVNLRRILNRRPGVIYTAAGCPYHLEHVRNFKRIGNRGDEPVNRMSAEWCLWREHAICGLATEPNTIHTGNSAWGALGLAYHLGFERVALVGVDGTDEPRIEGGRCRRLDHLPLLFASALPQINVTSCGKLPGIPQMTFSDWIAQQC